MAFLRFTDSSTFELQLDEISIGRSEVNTVVLNDLAASSHHSTLKKENHRWVLTDCQSRNGTWVDGKAIEVHELQDGETITVGQTDIKFLRPERAATSLVDPLPQDFEDTCNGSGIIVSLDLASYLDSGNTITGDNHNLTAEQKLHLIGLVSEKLVRVPDNERLGTEILEMTARLLDADQGSLCLIDDQLRPVPLATFGVDEFQGVNVSRTVLHQMLDQKAGVVVNPVQTEIIHSLVEYGVSSTLFAPLWTGDSIVGFMALEHTKPGRSFCEKDLDLALTIAHQVAVAMERSRLLEIAEHDREIRSYLSKYLDEKITKSILEKKTDGIDPLAPQEKNVTVLFCDIVSFTKMSERMEPRQLASFVREYLTIMTDVIFKHGGTIDKYIGDAIMALFGAPIDNQDAAPNAIKAALEMRERAKSILPPVPDFGPLRVRYGINTGPLVVGNIGSKRRVEYTAIGDTVNVASRLEAYARPDELLISESTWDAAGRALFDVGEIGAIDVRNRKQPLLVYKVHSSLMCDSTDAIPVAASPFVADDIATPFALG